MGREAGKKCVIIDIIDNSFVLITGPKDLTGVKRRRANAKHLYPLNHVIEITRGASDEEVDKVLQENAKTEYMESEVPPKRLARLQVTPIY